MVGEINMYATVSAQFSWRKRLLEHGRRNIVAGESLPEQECQNMVGRKRLLEQGCRNILPEEVAGTGVSEYGCRGSLPLPEQGCLNMVGAKR
jgi:hypothetical protein